MGGGGGRSTSTSSGEEDGDADWRAAIDTVATTANGFPCTSNGSTINSIGHPTKDHQLTNYEPQKLKHYQIKAQKLLDDILDKTIEIVRDPIHVLDNDPMMNDSGVRLFKDAPVGIVFDHMDEYQRPTKRPRILPGKAVDEKSKKFKRQVQSVSVDGIDIIAAASDAYRKSLAKREAKDAAAKAAVKREEERVAGLKKIRGERWLPSIARDMKRILGFVGHDQENMHYELIFGPHMEAPNVVSYFNRLFGKTTIAENATGKKQPNAAFGVHIFLQLHS